MAYACKAKQSIVVIIYQEGTNRSTVEKQSTIHAQCTNGPHLRCMGTIVLCEMTHFVGPAQYTTWIFFPLAKHSLSQFPHTLFEYSPHRHAVMPWHPASFDLWLFWSNRIYIRAKMRQTNRRIHQQQRKQHILNKNTTSWDRLNHPV